VAVSAQEAAQMQAFGFGDVKVLGHFRPLTLTARSWAERSGLLFVGALVSMDCPNYDSLLWFVDAVLPLLERELDHETRLTIVGTAENGVDLAPFWSHPRITVCGTVADLSALYDAHRVFVAPTRFAGGIPYKVHEAASYGLPVVATELLASQLGWEDERDLLTASAADPAAFAAQVLRLYRSEALWTRLRENAAERIRSECSREAWERTVAEILADAGTESK
jgi:glycosyltransferase involved in cell wall biosynthesis